MHTEEIFELIVLNIRQIAQISKNDIITRNSMLSPLGLDSIGRAELIEQMLDDLELRVPRCEFHTASNLGELAHLFAEKISVSQNWKCVA